MGLTVLLVTVLGAALLRAADEPRVVTTLNDNGLDYLGYPTNVLSALEKGRTDARRDVSNGTFRIPIYGLPMASSATYYKILKTRYGIEPMGLGGCIVSEGLVSYAKGYSEVSVAAIGARFGTNIFEQSWREAETGPHESSGAGMAPFAQKLASHRVKSGETLTSIAKQHRVSLDALVDVNPRVSPHRLQINQVLMLPPRTGGN